MIGYSITIIKGDYKWYAGSNSFKRNKGFDSFLCVFDIIQICFKVFVTISLFIFLHKGGEKDSIVFVQGSPW